ncbi:MAG: fimbrial assembly protein [Pseudomonadota bacterium]
MSQQINLFNPIFLKQKKHFSAVTMLQALLLIVLGSMLFYGYAKYQVKLLAKQTDEMNVRHEAEQKRLLNYINEFSPQRAQKLLNDELQMVEVQASMQEALLMTLKSGAFGNKQGYSEFMRAFARQTVKGLWLTGFNINGDGAQMSLQGAVVNPRLLPEYIQRMNREPVMRGKAFAALQMKLPASANNQQVNGYVEFDLRSIAAEEAGK